MSYTLYTYFRSSASYRVRIALNLKGLAYKTETRHLRHGDHRKADFLELNPQGLLPVLERDGQHYTQSLSIIEYLDEIGPGPRLLPDSAEERAVVRAMALVVACEMHPLCNLRVLQYLKRDLNQDDEKVKTWYRHWVAEGFSGLERTVAKHGGSRYCFGDGISLADVYLIPQMHNARRFDCDLSPYRLLCGIDEHLHEHPAFIAARPDRQPDAE